MIEATDGTDADADAGEDEEEGKDDKVDREEEDEEEEIVGPGSESSRCSTCLSDAAPVK